ncbi:MAG: TRAP transporter small permease [Eubacteriales bacterium]
MKKLEEFLKKINSFNIKFASVLLIISSVMIITQVILRYLFKFSYAWVEELSRYLIIYIVMFSSSYLLHNNENPFVEIVHENMSPKMKYIVNSIFYVFITLFLILLFYVGVEQSIKSIHKLTPGLRITMSIPYLAIPIGAFMMLIQIPYLFLKNKNDYKNYKGEN